MTHRTKLLFILIAAILSVCLSLGTSEASTAREILDEVIKKNFGDSFRIALQIKSFKGKKQISSHFMYLIGKTRPDGASFFVEFDEPEESKGLRFLFLVSKGKKPDAYMFLPATGKTLPLAVDDPSTDIGGTGLSMEDVQAFIPQHGEKETLVKEDEVVDGAQCYLIKVTLPDGRGERLLWVSKEDLLVVKSNFVAPNGKVQRTFRVVEFFKTKKGKKFPREEEIEIKGKGIRIRVKQETAVFGIRIEDCLMDPAKFGKCKWRI